MQKLLLIRSVEEKTQEFWLGEEESWDCRAELLPWHPANGWQILSGISWGIRCARHGEATKVGGGHKMREFVELILGSKAGGWG